MVSCCFGESQLLLKRQGCPEVFCWINRSSTFRFFWSGETRGLVPVWGLGVITMKSNTAFFTRGKWSCFLFYQVREFFYSLKFGFIACFKCIFKIAVKLLTWISQNLLIFIVVIGWSDCLENTFLLIRNVISRIEHRWDQMKTLYEKKRLWGRLQFQVWIWTLCIRLLIFLNRLNPITSIQNCILLLSQLKFWAHFLCSAWENCSIPGETYKYPRNFSQQPVNRMFLFWERH